MPIPRPSPKARNAAFDALAARGEIFPVQVEGVKGVLYCRERDRETLNRAMSGEALDHLHELSRGLVCDVPEHYHDLWNTTLASFMLALLEPLWARKAPLADVDDAGND